MGVEAGRSRFGMCDMLHACFAHFASSERHVKLTAMRGGGGPAKRHMLSVSLLHGCSSVTDVAMFCTAGSDDIWCGFGVFWVLGMKLCRIHCFIASTPFLHAPAIRLCCRGDG